MLESPKGRVVRRQREGISALLLPWPDRDRFKLLVCKKPLRELTVRIVHHVQEVLAIHGGEYGPEFVVRRSVCARSHGSTRDQIKYGMTGRTKVDILPFPL